MTDILIAGGGPAGLATAIHAALAGFSCCVVEPQQGVIDKACGEGLMPPAVAALDRIGVHPAGHPFAGIRYVDGDRHVDVRFRQGPGLGVRRTTLHEALLARADTLGITRLQGRVSHIHQGPAGVQATLSDNSSHEASWLVAADGLHSRLRRELRLGLPPRHTPRYGIRRHFAMAPWSEFVEVHWSPRAEAYVTPVSPDCVGVAMLFEGKATFEELLPQFPALHSRLPAPCTPAMGGGPFEQRTRRRIASRVLLVGDAAGFLDPLTGEGLRLGLLAAELLVAALATGRPATYDAAWRRLTRNYWILTSLLLHAQHNRTLRRCIVPLLQRAPALFDWGLHILMR
ncbi:MAG: NAD(P)/FAD-dependent oxidoreductase [Candidatus Xenobia bacterium]